jgi:hypothetical protein
MSPLVGSCWDFVLISDRGLLVKVIDTASFSKRYKNFFMTSDRGLLVMSKIFCHRIFCQAIFDKCLLVGVTVPKIKVRNPRPGGGGV